MVLALFGTDHDEWRTTLTLVGERNKPELLNKPRDDPAEAAQVGSL
jgi:hypothetical protein